MPVKKRVYSEEPYETTPKTGPEPPYDVHIGSSIHRGKSIESPLSDSASPDPVKEDKLVTTNSIYIEKSITKNLGDFNSAKISVGITLNVNPTEADIAAAQAAIKIASEIVDTEIDNQLKDL